MPHIFMDKLVVTKEELCPRFMTYNALKLAFNKAERRGYGIRRVMKGGNGRRLLIDYDSLPSGIREKIADPRVAANPMENFYTMDGSAIDFYSRYKRSDGTYLSDELVDKYALNASVLNAAIKLKEARERERISMNQPLRGVMTSVAVDVTNFNDILQKRHGTSHTLPKNPRRFAQKYSEYIDKGYGCLVSGLVGNKCAAVSDDATIALLNSMFTQKNKPTPAEIKRQYDGFLSGYVQVVDDATGELYDPAGYKKLSESLIRKYLTSWENRIGTSKFRIGDRQRLMALNTPYHSLDLPEFSGSLVSVDDRQPPFKYDKDNRAWFYLAQDGASLAITTWVYGKTKEGMIKDFYRQMVRNYHEWDIPLPYEIECESNLNSSFKNTFLQEGRMFNKVRIESCNARGKFIESRYNRAVRYDSRLEKAEEGWIARPFARGEANMIGSGDVPIRPFGDIIDMSLSHIERWNNMPHHSGNGMSRWEYFLEKQHPELKKPDYRKFIRHLGYHTDSSVNAGIIRLNKAEFLLGGDGEVATGSELITYMSQCEGRDIDVYWLDGNDGSMISALVYIGDTFICEAIPKPRYQRATLERTAEGQSARELMSAYVATIEGYSKRRKGEINRVTVLDERPITISDSFKIAGRRETAALETEEVEILPDIGEDSEERWPDRFTRRLEDRF